MNKRINLNEAQPGAIKALLALEKYVESTPLTITHKNLIKIRASQINGCAYCIDLHTRDARKTGEAERRVYNIASWRDTPFFSEQERAILALTEEVTLIHDHVADDTYNQAVNLLGENYAAQVIMAIITINAWNRIGISTKMEPA